MVSIRATVVLASTVMYLYLRETPQLGRVDRRQSCWAAKSVGANSPLGSLQTNQMIRL